MIGNRIVINGNELDVDQKIPFPVTFSQADAKQPESRKRSTSKTIELPGTVRNNAFFSSTFDYSITNLYNDLIGFNYDPTLRYPCQIFENGDLIFDGACNLLKVRRNKRVNRFMIVVYSEIVDIFQSLGDIKVSELDWSDYDHTLSVANIQASWSAATGSGYVYGLVHYGFTQNLLNYKTNQLYAHIYMLEFVQKCFALSGKTLSSTFLNTTRMKKLVWGHGGGEPITLSTSEVSDRQVHYTGDGSVSYTFPHSTYIPLINQTEYQYTKFIPVSDNAIVTMTPVTDTLAQFDQTNGEIIINSAGNYNLAVTGTFPITWTFSDLGFNVNYKMKLTVCLFKNGAIIAQPSEIFLDDDPNTANFTVNINQALDCSAGDSIQIILKLEMSVFVNDNSIGEELLVDFDLNNTLVMNLTATNSGIVDGDDVVLSRMLPEMSAADLLKDLMIAFNLYMSDPDQNGVITMEPMPDYFYGTDDVDNWTRKQATDEDIDIEPASNIPGKTFSFRWAEDRDYWKQRYFNIEGHDYGDFNYNVPSTFKKGVKLYQLKQAQTCPVRIDGTDIVIPMIVKRDSDSGPDQPYKGKPRMYFYNGLVSCDDWTLENSDTGALTTNTQYPQFHHLDSLTSAQFDLNFGAPVRVFYPATTYTNNNLFTAYHEDFIREMTSRDSKIVNSWFHLRSSDLYYNFMRKLVNIGGVIYRKNVVKDYLTGANKLTQVELIRVLKPHTRNKVTRIPPPITDPPAGYTETVTASTDITSHTKSVVADTSGGDITMTFDTSKYSYRERQTWDFVKVGANNLILTVASGESISGTTTHTIRVNYNAPEIIYKQGEFYFK